MITYKNGSLFNSNTDVIVNAVNCVGVMGKGIALEYKKRYPKMFTKYKKYCKQNLIEPGILQIFNENNKRILNFPTKIHWKNQSQISYIEKGLKKFVENYENKNIKSIAFPKLGCANGGLNWEEEVKPLMEKYLSDIDCDVEIWIY